MNGNKLDKNKLNDAMNERIDFLFYLFYGHSTMNIVFVRPEPNVMIYLYDFEEGNKLI